MICAWLKSFESLAEEQQYHRQSFILAYGLITFELASSRTFTHFDSIFEIM